MSARPPIDDPTDEPPGDHGRRAAGLFDSAREFLASLLGVAHTRLELLTTELEEEVQRGVLILIWASVAIFFSGLAVLAIALFVIIAFWENRLIAAGITALVFIAIAAIAIVQTRTQVSSRGGLLSATREELRRDTESLRRH